MNFVYDCTNWWGNKIYRNKDGFPIVKLEEGFYTLTDVSDIDSDPNMRIIDERVNIVDKL